MSQPPLLMSLFFDNLFDALVFVRFLKKPDLGNLYRKKIKSVKFGKEMVKFLNAGPAINHLSSKASAAEGILEAFVGS